MKSLAAALLSVLIGVVMVGTDGKATTDKAAVKIEKVTIGGEAFELELAADDATRVKGLSGRKSLDEHRGMLFVFPKSAVQSFWMADCLIDIDIVFLDSRSRIVKTHEMKKEPPQREDESRAAYEKRLKSYSSDQPSRFVIELAAGSIDRLEIKPGQTIQLETARLKKLAR